jgi:hypothetical protein
VQEGGIKNRTTDRTGHRFITEKSIVDKSKISSSADIYILG